MEGVRWLVHLFHNNINGILADEMGLGKTVQAIGMIAYLAEQTKGSKSFVIAPKSVLSNWMKEFSKWLPSLRVLMIGGTKEERAAQLRDVKSGNFDVVVTSFEVVSLEKAAFKKVTWSYMVVDEAHRLKNENSIFSQVVREFDTHIRLLLTGTPLQNNLHELWALLNFLLPEHFGDSEEFDALFHSSDTAQRVSARLQRVLRPFMLRRLKSDVESGLPAKTQVNLTIPLGTMQRKLYVNILKRDIDAINGKGGSKSRLLNIVMQLRKACNHPYLFEGQEPGPPYVEGEHLVENSPKLKVLDALLNKAKEEGARVLVFSQMTRMLDIIEDFCALRQHAYCRIDGGVSGEEREAQIDDFMRHDSDKLLFLLSTRAGGLGLNLQKANWVVLFDSDWNPQADIQAMDRCHRIGQTRPVTVFRFVTEHSVEERMVECALKKLFLDAMVVQQGRLSDKDAAADKEQLLEMIRFGADTVMKISDLDAALDLEHILRVGKLETEKLTKRFQDMAAASMSDNFRSDGGSYSQPQEVASGGHEEEEAGAGPGVLAAEFVLDIGRRERKAVQYNVDELQRQQGRRATEIQEEKKEERRRRQREGEETKDVGWVPDPKMQKALDLSSASIKGGKPGPADLLLRRLIEDDRKRGGDHATFQYRMSVDSYFNGRYGRDGLIQGDVMEESDREEDSQDEAHKTHTTRFLSLATISQMSYILT
jgi:SWI/SNF-related matrix-associated actin-dependent regulator of chromatin subfamily A member 5